jgi:hypothetical protein
MWRLNESAPTGKKTSVTAAMEDSPGYRRLIVIS